MIHVYMDRQQVKVHATEGQGWLILGDRKVAIGKNQEVCMKCLQE